LAEVLRVYKEASAKGINEEVSGYAKKNVKEFIAECSAESLNNPSPRNYAEVVAAIIRQRYSVKFPGKL